MTKTAPPATTMTPEAEPRYVFIDALRGIAAMAVVFCHLLVSPLAAPLERILPDLVRTILKNGSLGVQVFFVLSGFVIAHSLRKTVPTPRSIALFAARRQIRLDPPYWVIVFGSIAVAALTRRIAGASKTEPLPGPQAVMLNLVYLFNIARVPAIVDVAWTLCIEIQFYLFFALMMWPAQRGEAIGAPSRTSVAAVFATGVLSLFLDPNVFVGRWFTAYWCYFAAGVLCYWALRRTAPHRVFIMFLVLMCATSARHEFNLPLYVGVLAILGIYCAGLVNKLTSLSGGRVLQYLGRISYSLYLAHWPVKTVVLGVGFAITRQNGAAAVGWCVLMVAVSIAAAHVLYVTIERPSMRWASSFKERPTHASKQVGSGSPQDERPTGATATLDGVASC